MMVFQPTKFIIQLATLLCAITLGRVCYAEAPSTHIAVASNFNLAIKSLIAEFEKKGNVQVSASFASSGKLFAQIRYGAPFSIFLSADTDKPKLLAEKGLGDKESIFNYANGQLCLWTAGLIADSVRQNLEELSFNRLAIANPKIAPYGLAAQDALSSLRVKDKLKGKLVLGENVSQAFQFSLTKNADLGLVACSLLKPMIDTGQINTKQYWIVPAHLHTPIAQNAILLNKAKNDPVALSFYEFLKSDKAARIIQKHGYH